MSGNGIVNNVVAFIRGKLVLFDNNGTPNRWTTTLIDDGSGSSGVEVCVTACCSRKIREIHVSPEFTALTSVCNFVVARPWHCTTSAAATGEMVLRKDLRKQSHSVAQLANYQVEEDKREGKKREVSVNQLSMAKKHCMHKLTS
eukprot:gb/GECG01000578.1/.p1 GENE.gb/GECG01000578.1/~~gb/GECG01000578.1/.p1  ORF type:complete len:144 (+),score=12.43 gb/GECG01000578.1/:1-432(+)